MLLIRWRGVRSGVPWGSIWGPVLFNNLINGTDNGIKCTLDRFAHDMKPSGEDEEQKNGAIQRNLCKLKKWACMNSCSLVQVGIENSPAKEDLGPLRMKSWT